MKFVGKAVKACGKIAGRLHLGLRGQILLLGVAGVLVVGAIYLPVCRSRSGASARPIASARWKG